MSWRRFGDALEDKKNVTLKMSSKRLHEDESLFGKILKNYL